MMRRNIPRSSDEVSNCREPNLLQEMQRAMMKLLPTEERFIEPSEFLKTRSLLETISNSDSELFMVCTIT